jgi:hypothetical protein
MFPQQQTRKKHTCLNVVRAETRLQLSQFCAGICEEKRQLEGSRRSERTSAREADESPMLEAVAREWLVKIQQAGKDFEYDLCTVKISNGAVIACSIQLFVQVVNESIRQAKCRLYT